MVQGIPLVPPTKACSILEEEDVVFQEFMKRRGQGEWTAVQTFCWNDEAKAVSLINAETQNSAFQMIQNQPCNCTSALGKHIMGVNADGI